LSHSFAIKFFFLNIVEASKLSIVRLVVMESLR
jgi:hypothetical protein